MKCLVILLKKLLFDLILIFKYFQIVFAIFAFIGVSMAAPAKRSQSTIRYQPTHYQYQYQYQPLQLVDTVLTQDHIIPSSQIIYQDQTLPLVNEYIVEDLPVVGDSDLLILGAK